MDSQQGGLGGVFKACVGIRHRAILPEQTDNKTLQQTTITLLLPALPRTRFLQQLHPQYLDLHLRVEDDHVVAVLLHAPHKLPPLGQDCIVDHLLPHIPRQRFQMIRQSEGGGRREREGRMSRCQGGCIRGPFLYPQPPHRVLHPAPAIVLPLPPWSPCIDERVLGQHDPSTAKPLLANGNGGAPPRTSGALAQGASGRQRQRAGRLAEGVEMWRKLDQVHKHLNCFGLRTSTPVPYPGNSFHCPSPPFPVAVHPLCSFECRARGQPSAAAATVSLRH